MDRNQVEIRQLEENEQHKSTNITGWSTFIGVLVSGLVPLTMSFGLIRHLRDSLNLETLVLIGVVVILVAILLTVSIRQRYNERVYLRLWQARRERQRAREMLRQAQMREAQRYRSSQDSRAGRRAEAAREDTDASFEERLLRSLGVEPSP